jgi:hypothetical protein
MARLPFATLGIVTAVLALASSGCRLQHDPAKTVSIEITGLPDSTEGEKLRDRIDEAQKKSKKWTDGSSNVITWNAAGQQMTIEVTPVSDVDAFLKKIDFGEITAVEGRKIKMAYRPGGSAVLGLPLASDPNRREPSPNLRR